MTLNELHAKLEDLWSDFWPATELRPLAVVDFINCIFFLRQLEETESKKERSADFYGKSVEQSVFIPGAEDFRWSSIQHLDEQRLYLLFNKEKGVLDFIKNTNAYNKLRKFDDEGEGLKPIPPLLTKTVHLVSELDEADNSTRHLMNEYLLDKAETASKTRELELSTASVNRSTKKPERLKSKFSNVYVLLLIIFLTAFGATLLYYQFKKPNAASLNQRALLDSNSQTDTSLALASEKIQTKTNNKKTKEKAAKAEASQPMAHTSGHRKTLNTKKEGDVNKSNEETKALYKIISKAYFHNKPDESTRRNAFIVHWNNSYAKLKALDEKNGFIYVVFNNHLNQTSKGWLRKKDLEPIDE